MQFKLISFTFALQNLTIFTDISVFEPLNPSFLPKCTGKRFTFHRSICPYAGLPVVPLGSKVTADCRVSNYTSPRFFGGPTYLGSIFSCSTIAKMFPLLPPPERVIPIVGIIPTSQGCPRDVHHFGCSDSCC